MSSPKAIFQREHRYFVFKLKHLSTEDFDKLQEISDNYVMPSCVVVEADWSIYESVWMLVEGEWRKRSKP